MFLRKENFERNLKRFIKFNGPLLFDGPFFIVDMLDHGLEQYQLRFDVNSC